MRSISSAMRAMLDGNVHTLTRCWKVTRQDGVVLGFTSHSKTVVFDDGGGPVLYEAETGWTGSALEGRADLSVDTSSAIGLLVSPRITRNDLIAGRYDNAVVRTFWVNFEDLSASMGDIKGWEYTVGDITVEGDTFVCQLRSKTDKYNQHIVDLIGMACAVDLGSTKCGVVLHPAQFQVSGSYTARVDNETPGSTSVVRATDFTDGFLSTSRRFEVIQGGVAGAEPSWNLAIGGTTASGGVVFETQQGLSYVFEVASVIDNRTFTVTDDGDFPNDWWRLGLVEWLTGINTGLKMDIKSHGTTGGEFTLFEPMRLGIAVGDVFLATAGCDKFRDTAHGCVNKFRNIMNFRGFPDVPGNDQLLFVPPILQAA